MLFEADEQPDWPSGITVYNSLTTVRRGKPSSIGFNFQIQPNMIFCQNALFWVTRAADQNDSPVENSVEN